MSVKTILIADAEFDNGIWPLMSKDEQLEMVVIIVPLRFVRSLEYIERIEREFDNYRLLMIEKYYDHHLQQMKDAILKAEEAMVFPLHDEQRPYWKFNRQIKPVRLNQNRRRILRLARSTC